MKGRPPDQLLRLSLLALAVTLTSLQPAWAGEPMSWSLADAIQYGLDHSPDLAVAASQRVEKEEARAEVFSSFLPDLAFEGGYMYMDNVPRIPVNFTVDPPGSQTPPFEIYREALVGAQDNFKAKLTLNQLLFASGKVYYAHRAAKGQIESAREQEQALKIKVAERIAEACNGVLVANSAAAVQREALAAAQAHLQQVQDRFQAGAATRLERLRSQVEVSNLEPRVTEADKGIQIALTQLRRATGLSDGTDLVLVDSLEATVEPVDEEREFDRASRLRPELAALAHLKGAAEDQALAQRGAMLPTVALSGTFGYEKPYFAITEWEQNWTVGVGVKVPIFDGFEAYHGMRKARASAETLARSAVQTHADVQTEVQTALLDLHEAAVRIGTTRENLERVQEMLGVAEGSYRAGAATSLEVLDAQLAATTARLDHLRALYDYRVARVRLAAATGNLEAIGR